jgi:hypothetical protein
MSIIKILNDRLKQKEKDALKKSNFKLETEIVQNNVKNEELKEEMKMLKKLVDGLKEYHPLYLGAKIIKHALTIMAENEQYDFEIEAVYYQSMRIYFKHSRSWDKEVNHNVWRNKDAPVMAVFTKSGKVMLSLYKLEPK